MPSDILVNQYLDRIGAERPLRADIDALRHLQERHILSVPFENVDYHIEGSEISLDEDKLLDKIVLRRRGGGCYELNPAFAYLLRALGFNVEILPGKVFLGGRFGPPLCHMALRVELLNEPWLVDVGFGKNSRFPLRINSADVQQDPHGEFQVIQADTGEIEVRLNGNTQYQLDDRPSQLADYYPTLWWYRTAPDSVFLHNLICTIQTDLGRVTINGNRLTHTDDNGSHTEELTGDDAIREAYKEHFGISLDTLPTEPDIDPDIRIIMQID